MKVIMVTDITGKNMYFVGNTSGILLSDKKKYATQFTPERANELAAKLRNIHRWTFTVVRA